MKHSAEIAYANIFRNALNADMVCLRTSLAKSAEPSTSVLAIVGWFVDLG